MNLKDSDTLLIVKIKSQDYDYTSGWKISPIRLLNTKYMIVLYNQKILITKQIGNKLEYNLENGRIKFKELEDIELMYNQRNIIGEKIIYNTSNPATLCTAKKLLSIISDND